MNTETDQNQLSPGQRLQKARELKNISVDMVAQRLRLDAKLIHALDNDEYEQFPAIAYVRGHIRGYANMVDLDPEELIGSFDHNAKTGPSLEPFVSQPQQQAGMGDKHIKAVTYSVIAALVLLLGLWWQTQRSTQDVPDDQERLQVQTQTETVEEPALEIIEGTTGTLALPEEPPKDPTVENEPKELMHDFGVQYFSELPKPPEQNTMTESPESTMLSEQNWVESRQTIENDPDPGSITSSVDPVQIEDQGIVLQFTDESWVQITDATGKKRFSRLGKAGEVVNITGVAPFRVVIGRASVVIMSYQGSFIDLDPLAKDEVARFNLDENGAYR